MLIYCLSPRIYGNIFFDGKNIELDEPNYPVISMAQMYYENGYNIVIFSGRNDRSFSLVNTPGEIIVSAILLLFYIIGSILLFLYKYKEDLQTKTSIGDFFKSPINIKYVLRQLLLSSFF